MIDAKAAYAALQGGKSVFFDVRDPEAYKTAHIPGAVNVNEIFSYLGHSDAKGKEEMKNYFETVFRKAGLNGDENVITYEDCLKTRFGASCRGYYLLSLLGHNNVNVLEGGWGAWTKGGYPTTTEVPKVQEGTFKAGWNDNIYSGKEDVLRALKTRNAVLLDVRDFDEWKGESSSPYGKDFVPRKGRLEGAVHVLWKDLIGSEDGVTKIKSPEEVRKTMNEKGIDTDKEIIVYCFKGARASNTFIALQNAGFNNVKNYFASWNEWSRESQLPIDAKLYNQSSIAN